MPDSLCLKKPERTGSRLTLVAWPEYDIESWIGLAVRGFCVASLVLAAIGAWNSFGSTASRDSRMGRGGASVGAMSQVRTVVHE